MCLPSNSNACLYNNDRLKKMAEHKEKEKKVTAVFYVQRFGVVRGSFGEVWKLPL